MPTIYFAGQDNFGNRGCEALIRSSIKIIKHKIPNSSFLVPTRCGQHDVVQWPDAHMQNVDFISAEPIPNSIRWWGRARRTWSIFEKFPPAYRITQTTEAMLSRSDILIMTGGDILSLDYGLESLYYWTRICESAMNSGVPCVLWAASVGPFDSIPSAEEKMKRFLKRFSLITVRETASLKYLNKLEVMGAKLVADPAFSLDYESAPSSSISMFKKGRKVLGFNVSSLIRQFRKTTELKESLDDEIVKFLVDTLKYKNIDILLIPHVDPLDGSAVNSDSVYMTSILNKVRLQKLKLEKIEILPRTLNAAQLKDVIRRCTYFMGARTHATVAALSQCVPTTSIAYSVKAKGINEDLFGHLRFVLETPAVSHLSLKEHLDTLIREEDTIRADLLRRIPEWKNKANLSAEFLVPFVNSNKA